MKILEKHSNARDDRAQQPNLSQVLLRLFSFFLFNV
jgi:hypothetical protein